MVAINFGPSLGILRKLMAIASTLICICTAAPAAADEFLADSNGCKVYDPKPVPNEVVTWSGACKDGFADGPGVVQWVVDGKLSSGSEGSYFGGKLNGPAVMHFSSGATYQGETKDSHPQGHGVLILADGTRQEGDFDNGRLMPSKEVVAWFQTFNTRVNQALAKITAPAASGVVVLTTDIGADESLKGWKVKTSSGSPELDQYVLDGANSVTDVTALPVMGKSLTWSYRHGASPATEQSAATAEHRTGRKYAILSLVSDDLTLVGFQLTTGSHIAKNNTEKRALAVPIFDRGVLGSFRVALEHLDPNAQVSVIPPTDPHLYQIEEDVSEPAEQTKALVGPLQDSLKKQGVDELILVTKERAQTQVMSDRETLNDTGTLYGLGFYIDNTTKMQNSETTARGFLAPYIYVRVRRIDVNTLAVIKEKTVTSCKVVAIPSNSNANSAWDALNVEQKMAALMGLVRNEMTNVVPQLMTTAQ